MSSFELLYQKLNSGNYDIKLSQLYALDLQKDDLTAVRSRALNLMETFKTIFSSDGDVCLFSAPGRTEIGGNHTDHQHGHVLCGSVNLDALACAAPNGLNVIRICSEGYPSVEIDLEHLLPCSEERSSSAALVRGVAAGIQSQGYSVHGFDACVTSDVLAGSGLSSSAAYEVLIGTIMNHFFCGSKLTPVEIAKISQYAENVYFGKPCGLMDQMASSLGGILSIDFEDPNSPSIKKLNFSFSRSGHALCIVDTGSFHGNLTDDYASITSEMKAVAAYFGKQFLRNVKESDFEAALPYLRKNCGDRAVLRTMHYFADDRRATQESAALERGDFKAFLSLVNASGRSSALWLQNTWSTADPCQQAIPLALALGETLLSGAGALRVHGGGFAGTVQAFVPYKKLDLFKAGMERVFGPETCHILRIRTQGACVIEASS